jgi:hypothetical protein
VGGAETLPDDGSFNVNFGPDNGSSSNIEAYPNKLRPHNLISIFVNMKKTLSHIVLSVMLLLGIQTAANAGPILDPNTSYSTSAVIGHSLDTSGTTLIRLKDTQTGAILNDIPLTISALIPADFSQPYEMRFQSGDGITYGIDLLGLTRSGVNSLVFSAANNVKFAGSEFPNAYTLAITADSAAMRLIRIEPVQPPTNPVPVPSSLALLGIGLSTLRMATTRKKNDSKNSQA